MDLPPRVRQTVKIHLTVRLKVHCTAVGFNCRIAVVDDRGFFLTLQAIRTQLAAIPNELYLIRLIHDATRRAFPGERLWTAEQLGRLSP